jgi:hypothetical protein
MEEKNNYAYIAIVAIVAIVAVVVLMSGGSKTTVTPSITSGDMVGDAIKNNLRTGETLNFGDTTIERVNDGVITTKIYQEENQITGKIVNKKISSFIPDDRRAPITTCHHSGCSDGCVVTGCNPSIATCSGAECSGHPPGSCTSNPTCSKSSTAQGGNNLN